jgi:hypothetical protein
MTGKSLSTWRLSTRDLNLRLEASSSRSFQFWLGSRKRLEYAKSVFFAEHMAVLALPHICYDWGICSWTRTIQIYKNNELFFVAQLPGHCPPLCSHINGNLRNVPCIWKCEYFIIYSISIRWLWWLAEGIRALTYDPNLWDNMSAIKRALLQIYLRECYRFTFRAWNFIMYIIIISPDRF